ncbi:cytochrome c [Holotrichia oblita]|uniref:Cytochrome c n=1 Tax=Holotrichia oblita TaxID=644536 RepID=A0ACB9TBN0_HOLOL|nr:cytochrome c [Holotrichia oblita]
MKGGDVEKGKKIFLKQCSRCHSLDAKAGHGMGPNLHGVVGREAGSVPGFHFSNAFKKSEVIWTPENLSTYLKDPRKHIPKNNMPYCCLEDPEDRRHIIAYIESELK